MNATENSLSPGPKYPNVHVHLTGADGNVFNLAGLCGATAKRTGVPRAEITKFYAEVSSSGSYDEALRVMMRWFDVD